MLGIFSLFCAPWIMALVFVVLLYSVAQKTERSKGAWWLLLIPIYLISWASTGAAFLSVGLVALYFIDSSLWALIYLFCNFGFVLVTSGIVTYRIVKKAWKLRSRIAISIPWEDEEIETTGRHEEDLGDGVTLTQIIVDDTDVNYEVSDQ